MSEKFSLPLLAQTPKVVRKLVPEKITQPRARLRPRPASHATPDPPTRALMEAAALEDETPGGGMELTGKRVLRGTLSGEPKLNVFKSDKV